MLGIKFLSYLFCCAAAYLFSRTYVGWFGEYLLAAIIILPPVITLLSLPSMKALRISLSVPGIVNLGEDTELKINFRNRRLLPVKTCSFTLRIKNVYTGQEIIKAMRYILITECVSLVTLPTDSSGMLLCSLENICCYSYLGLIRTRPKAQDAACCIVMPIPMEPVNMDSLETARNDSISYRPKPGGGYSEEHELRVYRPGDSINSIHWKLSSKTDEIIVREPLEPVDNGTAVLLRTDTEIDLAHLYWLSLRLCAGNINHCINFGHSLSPIISNETDCIRVMRQLLSAPRTPFVDKSAGYSRIFNVTDGEVRWQ